MQDICEVCKQKKTVHKNRQTGQVICRNCLCEKCSECGKLKPVKRRGINGPICRNCARRASYRDISKYEKCYKCGKVKPVAGRSNDKEPICHSCNNKQRRHDSSKYEECVECDSFKPVAARDASGGAICKVCYQNSKIGVCVECKEVKVIQAKGCCRACYKREWRARQVHTPTTTVSTEVLQP